MAEAVKRNLHNNSNSKSKKSRNESIRSVLETYLKQRNYLSSDKFRKTDLVLSQDVDDKIMSALVDGEVSKCNSFRYSNVFCITNNPNQVDQQFSKLKTFIETQISIVKKELEVLLPPLMCHLYIEMLKGRDIAPASDFLKKFANIVAPIANTSSQPNHKINGSSIISLSSDESTPGLTNGIPPQIVFLTENIVTNDSENYSRRNAFKELVEVLSTIVRIQDIETKQLIVDFRSNKYPVRISTYSSYLLKKYLAQHGHILILQIFQLWFHFDLTIDEINDDVEFDEDDFTNILLNQNEQNEFMYSLTLHENSNNYNNNNNLMNSNEAFNFNLLDNNSLTNELQMITNIDDVPLNTVSNDSINMDNNTNDKTNKLDNNINYNDITNRLDNSNTNFNEIMDIGSTSQLNNISNLDNSSMSIDVINSKFKDFSKIQNDSCFNDLKVEISNKTFGDTITDFSDIICNDIKSNFDNSALNGDNVTDTVKPINDIENFDKIANIESATDISNITDIENIAAIDSITNIDNITNIEDSIKMDYSENDESTTKVNNSATVENAESTKDTDNLTNDKNVNIVDQVASVTFDTNFEGLQPDNKLDNIESSTRSTENGTSVDDVKIIDTIKVEQAANGVNKSNTVDTSIDITKSIENVNEVPMIDKDIDKNINIENTISNVPDLIKINYKPNVDDITTNFNSNIVTDLTSVDLDNIVTIDSNLLDDLSKKTDFLTASQKKLDKFKASIAKLSKYQLPVRVLNIINSDNKLSAASVDPHECHIAGAFENSTICLWSMNKSIYSGRKPYLTHDRMLCEFSVDNCNLSENESSSSDEECHNIRRATNSKRRITKRERWRQFMEKRSDENTFTESGGILLRGHNKGVTDVLFLEHSPLLMSVSKDLTMRAWKASDYTCGAVYRGHNHPIWCVAESPTGLYLATGSRDSTARLWTTDRQYPLQIYVGHSQDVDTVAFHPNGNYLATGSTDLSVRMWCVTSGKLLRVFTECRLPVNCVKFSPDGKFLAAASEELIVRIFDLAAGTQLCELKDHLSSVTSIAWSADSKFIISSCKDGTIRLWNIQKLDNYFLSYNIQMNAPSTSAAHHAHHTTNYKSNLIMSYGTNCKRLIKAHYNLNNTITCIGNN